MGHAGHIGVGLGQTFVQVWWTACLPFYPASLSFLQLLSPASQWLPTTSCDSAHAHALSPSPFLLLQGTSLLHRRFPPCLLPRAGWIDADYILASSAVGRLKADDQQAPPRLPGITEEAVPTEGQQGGGTRQPATHSGGQIECPPSSELGALSLESKGGPNGSSAGDKQRREPEAPA